MGRKSDSQITGMMGNKFGRLKSEMYRVSYMKTGNGTVESFYNFLRNILSQINKRNAFVEKATVE